MKLVKEHINEKFTEDSDPVHDLGIGIFVQELNKIKDIKYDHEISMYLFNYGFYLSSSRTIRRILEFIIEDKMPIQEAYEKSIKKTIKDGSKGLHKNDVQERVIKYFKTKFNVKINPIDVDNVVSLAEGVADKYAEKEFNLAAPHSEFEEKYKSQKAQEETKPNVVATVGNYKTPIVLNPKSLKGFGEDVRAIADKNGNLFVAMYNKAFVHGTMANRLMDARAINTIKFDEKAVDIEKAKGIYQDQKNFLLLNRLEDSDLFIQSDTFKDQGNDTEEMLKKLKEKNPQFRYNLNF